MFTRERFSFCVDTLVDLQRKFFSETLVTLLTLERCVATLVYRQKYQRLETLTTVFTLERFTQVDTLVCLQITCPGESLIAIFALERFYSSVDMLVSLQFR